MKLDAPLVEDLQVPSTSCLRLFTVLTQSEAREREARYEQNYIEVRSVAERDVSTMLMDI